MSAETVRSFLMEHGVRYRMHSHTPAYTAPEVAEAEHVSGKEMAKAVMLFADDQLVMAVLPSDRKVDLDKAARALDVDTVRIARESEFSPRFPDCEIGAEPPFGGLYGVKTVVDESFDGMEITFNAGTHTEAITMDFDDYLELAKSRRADLASAG